jgi:hypothetical protein
MPGQRNLHKGAIANVAPVEDSVRLTSHADKYLEVACLGKLIEVDDRLIEARPPVEPKFSPIKS